MMKKYLFVTLLLVSFISVDIWAQFSIKAQLRTRGEWRNGYKTLPTEDTDALLMVGQRSRLIFGYKNDKLEAKIAVQDARIWGESKWKTDNADVGLFEGWAKYSFSDKFATKIGRQVLSYDDARLFCSGDWRTYAEAIDAALFVYKNKKSTLHLGLAVNSNEDAETAAFYTNELESPQFENLAYLWFNQKFGDKGSNISLLAVQDGHQRQDDVIDDVTIEYPGEINYRYTAGTYFKWKTDLGIVEGAYYQQLGTSDKELDINSNFYSAKVTYPIGKKYSLAVGYDHYSGTDYSDEGSAKETNTFTALYGPGHKYLGYMDYFGVVSKVGIGVNDLIVSGKAKLFWGINMMLDVHMFSADQEYYKIDGEVTKLDKNLGTEFDFVFKKKFDDQLTVMAGYSFMIAEESMELIKLKKTGTSETPHFAHLTFNFTPEFFNTK